MQVFTPRKPKSAWSALNRARVERLMAAGLMTPAGLAAVKAAKDSGAWNTWNQVDDLTIPHDLEKALQANPDASRNWASYSPGRRKGVLYRLAGAKRPATRERYLRDIIENMTSKLSRAELMEKAGFRPRPKSVRQVKR